MGKRSAVNYTGSERPSKLRRMGKVDRDQQGEIDQLQSLFRPEPKEWQSYSAATSRPNILGTVGATDGPLYLNPWDDIGRGANDNQRVGSQFLCHKFQLECILDWDSYYGTVDDPQLITNQGVRVDAFWVKNCKDSMPTGAEIPEYWRIKNMARFEGIAGRQQYVLGGGTRATNLQELRDITWAKSWHIKAPRQVRHGPLMNKEFKNFKVGHDVTTAVAPSGTNAIITVPGPQSNMVDKQYEQISEFSHSGCTTNHVFSFPLPKAGWKVRYGDANAADVDNDHMINEWIPVFILSWYGECNVKLSGLQTPIVAGSATGNLTVQRHLLHVGFRDI